MRLLLLLLALLLTGCSQPPPAVAKIGDLPNQPGLIGQRVTLDGFVGAPRDVAEGAYNIPVYDNALGAGDWRSGHPPQGVMVSGIPVGSGPNQMEKLSDGFRESSIKVHTAADKVLQVGDPIRVTGTLARYNPNPEVDVFSLNAPIVFEQP